MSAIEKNIASIKQQLTKKECDLLLVTKNQSIDKIRVAYQVGQRNFGENRVQELVKKQEALPSDIKWHMIGHLQRNKVKYIAYFVSLIHSIDSIELLVQVNKEGKKINRIIPCLLQIHIADEDSKYGMEEQQAIAILTNAATYPFILFNGLMGMATMTNDMAQIRREFSRLSQFYKLTKNNYYGKNVLFKELSMGMSSDYLIAIEQDSTLVRIGSAIFQEDQRDE